MYKNPFSTRHFWKWFLLAFIAGAVNTGAFLACGRFVTHVTGFATLTGVDLAQHDYTDALGVLSIPLFFLAGTMVSAVLIDRRMMLHKQPLFSLVFSLVTLCLFAVTVLGAVGRFGHFGAEIYLRYDHLFLSLLCLASGLQNAAITTISGHAIRTTHLTGLTTDLGIGIVRAWFGIKDRSRRRQEQRSNWLRVGTIASFFGGSWAGAFCYLRWEYYGFLLPAGIALFHTLITYRWERLYHLDQKKEASL